MTTNFSLPQKNEKKNHTKIIKISQHYQTMTIAEFKPDSGTQER